MANSLKKSQNPIFSANYDISWRGIWNYEKSLKPGVDKHSSTLPHIIYYTCRKYYDERHCIWSDTDRGLSQFINSLSSIHKNIVLMHQIWLLNIAEWLWTVKNLYNYIINALKHSICLSFQSPLSFFVLHKDALLNS